MGNSLYNLPFNIHLPVLSELDQQIRMSKYPFEKGTPFLFLRSFDLMAKHLSRIETGSQPGGARLLATVVGWSENARHSWSNKTLDEEFYKAQEMVAMVFPGTGKVEGFLYLGPNFQKIWLSLYDAQFLERTCSVD